MARHTTMWLMAGGSALLGSAMAFAMRSQPVLSTARSVVSGADKFRNWLASYCEEAAGSRTASARDGYYNAAYDEYRAVVLRRLAEEEREFQAFLERIRAARDREEFDAFLAERRGGTSASHVSP